MVETNKNWFKRHKVWTGIIGFFVLMFIVGIFVGDNSSNKTTGNVVNENQDIKENTQTIYVCPDGSQVYDSSQCSSASAQTQNNPQNTQTTTSTQTSTQTTTTTPAVEETSDKTTMGERNALSKALSYLDVMAFSYSGLIKQLEYEGYSHEEAKYGADNCEVDWNEQAALKAQSYLDVMAFSRQGLIDQLVYEGFTSSQAEYGANAVGY